MVNMDSEKVFVIISFPHLLAPSVQIFMIIQVTNLVLLFFMSVEVFRKYPVTIDASRSNQFQRTSGFETIQFKFCPKKLSIP